MRYESVIGLEVHVQIKTASKLFCGCGTAFGALPNQQVCPVCCGYPGTLPVLNQKAVEGLVKTGLALGCTINAESIFARKQYFYPDLPKNYQITQLENPLALHGGVEITMGDNPPRTIALTRIHLEEDAGKLLHAANGSLVDLNRTGIGLMEIVSEPELRSPEEAQIYLANLKLILQYLDVSDCDMEKGSLRCDANISIRPEGATALGTKVEVKNMNSFKALKEAAEYEIARQIQMTESGERIRQETRLWDADKKESRAMRSKEEAHDYRYFPEPDLLPLHISEEWIENIRKQLPELPAAKKQRFMKEFQLSAYDAGVLSASLELANFFEKCCAQQTQSSAPKLLCNWITSDLLGRLNAENKTLAENPVSAEHLSELVQLIAEGTISNKIAKNVFDEMWATQKKPKAIVQEKGWAQVSDSSVIEQWVDEAIASNPQAAQEYKNGKTQAIGALVGKVMKLSKGQAQPEKAQALLKEKLK